MKKNKMLDTLILIAGTMTSVIILSMRTARAYIDPSVTTYALQAIIGIVVAVGAFVTVFVRKFKKKVATTLHIDENQKKEVEDELQEIEKTDDKQDKE